MFSGHFNIPNHSGTAQKPRRAFSKIKELHRTKARTQSGRTKTPTSPNYARDNHSNNWATHFRLIAGAILFVALTGISWIVVSNFDNFKGAPYQVEVQLNKEQQEVRRRISYRLLVREGFDYLKFNQLDRAQTSFVLALGWDEYGQSARIGLTKTLVRKCTSFGKSCEEAAQNLAFVRDMKYLSEPEVQGLMNQLLYP